MGLNHQYSLNYFVKLHINVVIVVVEWVCKCADNMLLPHVKACMGSSWSASVIVINNYYLLQTVRIMPFAALVIGSKITNYCLKALIVM